MLQEMQHLSPRRSRAHNAAVLLSRAVSLLAAFNVAFSPVIAYANPQGGVVSAGSATIISNGNELDINQTTNSAVINWSSFNIAKGEITKITQPSASSMELDRVSDVNASQIFG